MERLAAMMKLRFTSNGVDAQWLRHNTRENFWLKLGWKYL
jgi:hypothetical protein